MRPCTLEIHYGSHVLEMDLHRYFEIHEFWIKMFNNLDPSLTTSPYSRCDICSHPRSHLVLPPDVPFILVELVVLSKSLVSPLHDRNIST